MTKKPLLMVKLTPAVMIIKVKKTKAKKKIKKKVKKKVVPIPVRESPFVIGDQVWVSDGMVYSSATITGCKKPTGGDQVWDYDLSDGAHYREYSLLPAKLFHLNATDANRIKIAPFQDKLNDSFGGEAMIFQVFRKGQKRPWCYYVLPDGFSRIFHTIKWKEKNYYSSNTEREGVAHCTTAAKLNIRLLPISSAPREILTYLGLHVYSRLWTKAEVPFEN